MDKDNSMVVTRGGQQWKKLVKGTGGKYVAMEGDLTLGGRHTVQYTDYVL